MPISKSKKKMASDPTTKSPEEKAEAKMAALTLETNSAATPAALSVSTKPAKKKSKKVVADSWDDEDLSDSSDGETTKEPPTPTLAGTSAPPPTPISPPPAARHQQYNQQSEPWSAPSHARQGSDGSSIAGKRPEKTDAVARRMIAAGLGLKAPKQTDEQKAYQQSVREQEKKKREAERAEEQRRKDDIEKAKAAIWDD